MHLEVLGVMDINILINKTYITKSSIHGWGVFALEDITEDEVVMQCIYKDIGLSTPLPLKPYTFGIGKIVLGNASFINGAGSKLNKNVKFEFDTERGIVNIKALQAISKNEELLLNY